MLIPKAKSALEKYGHQIVIGNILQTRKKRVSFVYSQKDVETIELTDSQLNLGIEIESLIVEKLCENHKNFIYNKNL